MVRVRARYNNGRGSGHADGNKELVLYLVARWHFIL